MNPEPLVSIIIPTFNRANLLTETLDSVISQTYQNWECIIVDDGSTDDTESVVDKFILKDERIKYFKRPDNYKSGGNGARNYGFHLSKGMYINWFDSDDVMLPNFIEEKINNEDENLDFIISTGFLWESTNNIKKKLELKIETNLYDDYMLWNLKILTPSLMFRREYLANKKLFSDKISRGQETELYSRLFIKSSADRYKISNTPTFLYRQHEDTKSNMAAEPYNMNLKRSRFIILSQNFIMCENIEKKIMISFYYQELITLFFQSLYFNDFILAKDIIAFFKRLNYYNYIKAFEINLVTKVFLVMAKNGVRIKGTSIFKNRWINFFKF